MTKSFYIKKYLQSKTFYVHSHYIDNMNMSTQITIKTDETLKQEFAKFVAELGMSVSTAFNLFMKDCVRNKRMNISLDLNDENRQARKNVEDGDFAHTFKSEEEFSKFMKEL